MSETLCRVNIELNQWQAKQWDCTCNENKYGDKCDNCIYHDPNYFDEPDSYNND